MNNQNEKVNLNDLYSKYEEEYESVVIKKNCLILLKNF